MILSYRSNSVDIELVRPIAFFTIIQFSFPLKYVENLIYALIVVITTTMQGIHWDVVEELIYGVS